MLGGVANKAGWINSAAPRRPSQPVNWAGLTWLKRRYTICTLSIGNIGWHADMAKRAALPWDCILSAEVFESTSPPRQPTWVSPRSLMSRQER